ncbi:hypothetical protein GCM10027610_038790 [Dactylosporangium cerinum]
MAFPQGRAGIGAEPVGKRLPRPLVQVEGVGLATLGGQGVHLQRGDPLVGRMLGEQRREAGGGVAGTAQRQLRLGEVCGGLDRGAVQPHRDGGGDRGDHRRSTGQRDRLAEDLRRRPGIAGAQPVPAARGQPLEPQRVDVVLGDVQAVPGLGLGDSGGIAEQPAQPGHQRLQRVGRVGRPVLRPQRLDQQARVDRPAAGQRQSCDQVAEPGAGDGHLDVAAAHLQGTEQRHP